MSMTTSAQIGSAGRMVLALETPPWDSAYRALIGYGIMPAYLQLFGGSSEIWKLLAFFLAILAALRIVPGVLRRVLPFSREVKTVWADRRALAKRYDSYQWRKLFGIGLGWLAYLVIAGKDRDLPLFLAVVCVLAGAFGLAFWHKHRKVLAAQTNAAAPAAPASA
jgi:hypothetical protein